MGIFSRFGLLPTPPVKRPRDLAYAAMERPPMGTLAILAGQHVATALALLAYVLAAAHIGGLDADSTRKLVSAAVIGMAVATALQAIGGSTGSGTMLVHIPDPLIVAISGMVCMEYGVGGMVVVCIFNGLTGIVSSFIVPRLRAILPPTVAGVVVCVGGLSLVEPALVHTTGYTDGSLNASDALLGGVTLLVIMGISIWGGRSLKLFALLSGVVVGVVLSALLGQLHGIEALADTPLFGLPSFATPRFDIPIDVLIAVGLLALMVQLDTFASVVLMQKMDDADWRRADMRMVSGGIRAGSLGALVSAPLGGYPNVVSSANLALCHISRSTSRWIGLAVAGLLLVLAFMPMLARAMTLIPTAVIGAVEIYAAAYLIVSGIELIASRAMDARGIFMVGLAFVAGISVMLMPGLSELFPDSVSFISRNGIVVAGLTAILLNLAFRFGSSQRDAQPLHDIESEKALAERVTGFIESCGAAWGARRDTIRRAAQAALEAIELLHTDNARRATEIRARFDEFNLDIEILHEGPPLELTRTAAGTSAQAFVQDPTPISAQTSNTAASEPVSMSVPAPINILDVDDDEFEAALAQTMRQVSHNLMRRLADRVHSEHKQGRSMLRLHFDH